VKQGACQAEKRTDGPTSTYSPSVGWVRRCSRPEASRCSSSIGSPTLSTRIAGTWIFSDIKFQADMGLPLTFMFLWNMVGAVVLLPALAAVMRLGAGPPVGATRQPAAV